MGIEMIMVAICFSFLLVVCLVMLIVMLNISSNARKERIDYINRILSKNSDEYLKLKNSKPTSREVEREGRTHNGVYFPGMENDVL